MYKVYEVDESEVNKRNVAEFGYDFYSPYRVVERTGKKEYASYRIIESYIGKGAKRAAQELCQRLNIEAKKEWMLANPPRTLKDFLRG